MQGQEYSDKYSQEIVEQYKQHEKKIKCIHSDLLNLDIVRVEGEDGVVSKGVFKYDDIILEVRGKVTTEDKLHQYLHTLGSDQERRELTHNMLMLNKGRKIALKPTNLGSILIESALKPGTQAPNCYLEIRHESKAFVRASSIIIEGETLHLDPKSLQPHLL